MAWISLLDIVYPVGSIYISAVDKSPAEIVGGTWTGLFNTSTLRNYVPNTVVEGQAPLGDYAGENFIRVDNMPSHTHSVTGGAHQHSIRYAQSGVRSGSYWQPVTTNWDGTSQSYIVEGGSHTHTVGAVGGGREVLGSPYLCPYVEAHCIKIQGEW